MTAPARPALDACHLIDLPRVSDARGALSFVEGQRHVPFDIARVYYLYDLGPAVTRGAHGHKALEQLIIAVAGRFEITLSDGQQSRRFELSRPDQGLYVGPMIWRDLGGFSEGAVCLVLASLPYDEADYFRDHAAYLEAVSAS
ncbi:dTDP-4-dehydrorhamnose 3,5-epimerase-like enzyme [Rubricella aquisinus]|uniref:dTDP-4-dehydrorhamnose 3,5-epimerase-like enzyme n=1 Tax=Rubricella aquisinus TaxID=2028108 RepID=A0A840X163_9RHOB|nr:FdtA/QdtA family cupin domain-containing protein [Rubricella aquisinus]MBB5515635.1 dTDP-4-dehydrorhamnose 3,5-epimerase-like enzyme [Rubricella aquisinus]